MKIKLIFILLSATLLFGKDTLAADYRDITLENRLLDGESVFSGKIFIKGRIIISEGSSLVVMPGTDVIFIFVDEDKDGLGESEILSQGNVQVRGTKEKPVIFHSDRHQKGAWLGLSIMNVDKENVFQNAIFEDSYMGLHSHFSNLAVNECIFRNNMRGFQSQEGVIRLEGNQFYRNNSGIQFRNSKAFMMKNLISDNEVGMNFLYSTVTMNDTVLENNRLYGVKIRFSKALMKDLKTSKSLQNIYGKNCEVDFENVATEDSYMRGFSFEDSVIKIKNSRAVGNMMDGLYLDNSRAECENFSLKNNGRHHIYLKGKSSISGSYTMSGTKTEIHREP